MRVITKSMNMNESLNPKYQALTGVLKQCCLLHRSVIIRRVQQKGTSPPDADPFSLVYIGEGESLHYISKLLFINLHEDNRSGMSILTLRRTMDRYRSKNAPVVQHCPSIHDTRWQAPMARRKARTAAPCVGRVGPRRGVSRLGLGKCLVARILRRRDAGRAQPAVVRAGGLRRRQPRRARTVVSRA